MAEDTRKPLAGFLNYKGDVRNNFDMTRPYGPKDITHEMIFPVTTEYDEDKNITRVGFSYQHPTGWTANG